MLRKEKKGVPPVSRENREENDKKKNEKKIIKINAIVSFDRDLHDADFDAFRAIKLWREDGMRFIILTCTTNWPTSADMLLPRHTLYFSRDMMRTAPSSCCQIKSRVPSLLFSDER